MSTPAPDLAEAEQWTRRVARGSWPTASATSANLPVLLAEYDRLRAEIATAESTIAALEDPEVRAALTSETTGDFGPVPDPRSAPGAPREMCSCGGIGFSHRMSDEHSPVATPGVPTPGDYEPICGDMGGPHGVGGPCALPPGHELHRDGIEGEWAASPGADTPAEEDRERLCTAANAVIQPWLRANLDLCRAGIGGKDAEEQAQLRILDAVQHVHLSGVEYSLTPLVVDAILAARAARSPQPTPAPPATEEPQPAEGGAA